MNHHSAALPIRSQPEGGKKRPARGRPRIANLRERILASAIQMFSENGIGEVAIERLAAAAGVGKGSIYREFGSKEALYAAAVIEGVGELRRQIEQLLSRAGSGGEALTIFVRQTAGFFWDRGEFFALLRDPNALPPKQLRHFRRERASLSRLLVQLLRSGTASGTFRDDLDSELLSEAILGMIRGIRRHRGKHVILEDAIETILALLADGGMAKMARNGNRKRRLS